MPTILHDSQLTREQRSIVELRAERHRLVMGPPGSGKTQVLLHRTRWLMQAYKIPPERFCVLVYTNVLTYYLRQSLEFLGIPKENVRTFDDWCGDLWEQHLTGKKPRTPKDKRGKTYVDFPAVRVDVLKAISGSNPDASNFQFDFVLVDEGQDLDTTAYGILRAAAKHLTVFADARQQIFEGGASVDEMLKLLSLSGQTASLLPAYRNSPDIAKLACYFGNAFEGMNYQAKQQQKPTLYIASDWEDEIDHLADALREQRLQNHKCGIIVPTNFDLYSVKKKLEERGVEVHPAVAARRGSTPPDFDSLTPVIASYHSAKGLTFDCVLMPKLVENNFKRVPAEIRKRLLLVGITRATKWVYFSSVIEYELNELDTIRLAASNGDVFIKDPSVATTPPIDTQGTDDEEDLFL